MGIYSRGDNTYVVDGYVEKTGVTRTSGDVTLSFVKGVSYKTYGNRYRNEIRALKKELSALQASLNFKYTFKKKLPSATPLTTYDLNDYLKKGDGYNSAKWVSVDNDIATISEDGMLVFKAPGTVTATVKGSVSGKKTSCKFSCDEKYKFVIDNMNNVSWGTQVDIEKYEGEYYVSPCEYGEQFKIVCETKSGIEYEETYKSSDESVVTIDEDGVISIISNGVWDGNGKYERTVVEVTISSELFEETFYLEVYPIEYDFGINNISEGTSVDIEKYQGEYYVSPCEYGDQFKIVCETKSRIEYEETYKSSNESIVTIDEDGVISIISNGVQDDNGKCKETVVEVTISSELFEETIYLKVYPINLTVKAVAEDWEETLGSTNDYLSSVYYNYSYGKTVQFELEGAKKDRLEYTYEVDDASVATIDENGLMTINATTYEYGYITIGCEFGIIAKIHYCIGGVDGSNITVNAELVSDTPRDNFDFYMSGRDGYVYGIYEGDQIQLKLDPELSDKYPYVFTTACDVLSVDESGLVTVTGDRYHNRQSVGIYLGTYYAEITFYVVSSEW